MSNGPEFRDRTAPTKVYFLQNDGPDRDSRAILRVGSFDTDDGHSSVLVKLPRPTVAEMIPFLQRFADTGSVTKEVKTLTFDIRNCDSTRESLLYAKAVQTTLEKLGVEYEYSEYSQDDTQLTVRLKD